MVLVVVVVAVAERTVLTSLRDFQVADSGNDQAFVRAAANAV